MGDPKATPFRNLFENLPYNSPSVHYIRNLTLRLTRYLVSRRSVALGDRDHLNNPGVRILSWRNWIGTLSEHRMTFTTLQTFTICDRRAGGLWSLVSCNRSPHCPDHYIIPRPVQSNFTYMDHERLTCGSLTCSCLRGLLKGVFGAVKHLGYLVHAYRLRSSCSHCVFLYRQSAQSYISMATTYIGLNHVGQGRF